MISVCDIFKIGIGPSSSHTVGPMKAAGAFAKQLLADQQVGRAARIAVRLLGSLAFTGKGHATDRAVLLGLGELLPTPSAATTRSVCLQRRTKAVDCVWAASTISHSIRHMT